jgi:Cu2+-exporting ATPase
VLLGHWFEMRARGGALPIAAGVFVPSLGPELRPEIAALTHVWVRLIVAVNALLLKRLRLPHPEQPHQLDDGDRPSPAPTADRAQP